MRLLHDENVPVRFVSDVAGHESVHVRSLGWLSMPDREIAVRATGSFDAILTLDTSFPAELVGLADHPAILVLSPRSHRLPHLQEMLPQILATLATIQPGEVVRLYRPPPVLT
jgi:predicted nuclease of predicted toxin-antitoxin system